MAAVELEGPPGRQVHLNLKEIAARVDIALGHPDRQVRRQVQGVVANDALGLLIAVKSLMDRVAELERDLLGLMSDTHDGMTFWFAALARSGGEYRFPKDWFAEFSPGGGWEVETTDTEIIVRHVAAEAPEGEPDGPSDG